MKFLKSVNNYISFRTIIKLNFTRNFVEKRNLILLMSCIQLPNVVMIRNAIIISIQIFVSGEASQHNQHSYKTQQGRRDHNERMPCKWGAKCHDHRIPCKWRIECHSHYNHHRTQYSHLDF
jgi:hypothetical protein